MKNGRLFQLVYLLLEKGSLTAPELANTLEVSVRTIYRDVETLSSAGIPIYAAVGKGGGISLLPGYSFQKALLSDSEQNQILFAIQSMQAADLSGSALLNKLGGMFQKQSVQWIEVDFSRWGFTQIDHVRFDTLKTAILQKRLLTIRYCGVSGDVTQRTVKPLKLIFKDKKWYLQAFCLKAQDFRLFKVNRMIDFSLSQETFSEVLEAPLAFDENPISSIPTVTMRLRFSSKIAYRVYDEFDPREIEKKADGSLELQASFPFDDWMLGYLTTFGTALTILDPPDLRAQLSKFATNIGKHHQT